jgi:hypothetical protein
MDSVFFCGVPVGCVMAYGFVMDAKRQARELERDRRGWREYSARRGFRYSCPSKVFSRSAHHRFEGRVHGVEVSCITGPGILRMPTTTLSALAPVPVDGRLYASCAEVFSQGQEDVLARRVDVNDPAFNGAEFLVEATTMDVADRILVPSVRDVLLRMRASGRQSLNFRCERDVVAVEWLGNEALPDLFDLGCDLMVAACASRRQAGIYR